jgi:exopolyphosphatase / guanosine-5'-triphosphate,3'-diphosphate pyrophosphatase
VDEYLTKAPVLKSLKGRSFLAVGGAWRNLARLHMAERDYPLHVLHGYRMSEHEAEHLAEMLHKPGEGTPKGMEDMSKARADTLPYAAMILQRLMELGQARDVVVSVYGVREGLLYARLPKKKMEQDALLSSCWDVARRYARSPAHELELCDWTDQLFGKGKLVESVDEKRLRYAACLLADIGWRAHPDYRAERSLGMIAQAAFTGIDHPGRVFLALTIFYRYDGEDMRQDMLQLISERAISRAHLLSSLFRLAYILSAAMPRMLPKIGLAVDATTLQLRLPKKLADLMGERVEKRLSELAKELQLSPKVVIK